MKRRETVIELLVAEQPGRSRLHRVCDLRAQAREHFEAAKCVDPHAEVDHYEVGIIGQIDRIALHPATHGDTVQDKRYTDAARSSLRRATYDAIESVPWSCPLVLFRNDGVALEKS